MKKTIALVVALALAFVTGADPVTPEQAELAAKGWLAQSGRVGCTITHSGEYVVDEDGSFHVFDVDGGGFIIASADTEIEPVIVCSDSGTLVEGDGNPLWDIVRADLAARMAHARRTARGDRTATDEPNAGGSTADKWATLIRVGEESDRTNLCMSRGDALSSISDVRVAPLLRTEWSQEDYQNFGSSAADKVCYNYYTPNNWPCGCVATAGAQLMRYFKYPSSSVTPGSYACAINGSPCELLMIGGTYDWDNMPEKPANGCTDEQREAIGKLTYDIGVSVGMKYGSGGSSSSAYMLAKRLVDRFGYGNANGVTFNTSLYNYGYSLERLKAAVIPNLMAKWPVVLGLNGHAVVADGYGYSGGSFYLHINMGWANKDGGNAWYLPPNIDDYSAINDIVYNVDMINRDVTLVCGRVLDASSNPVPNATITVTDGNGGNRFETTADMNGDYVFSVTCSSKSAITMKITAAARGLSGSVTTTAKKCVSTDYTDDGYFTSSVTPAINNQYGLDIVLRSDPGPGGDEEPIEPVDPGPGGDTDNPQFQCALMSSTLTLGTPVRYSVKVTHPSGVKSFSFSGLPSGLKYDKKLNAIVGTPSKAGKEKNGYKYTVKITVKAGDKKTYKGEFWVKVPELSNIVIGNYGGFICHNGKYGILKMKIAKNGKATGKITFGDKKKSLAIESGYFTDVSGESAKYRLTFKDGSVLNMVFASSRMGGYEYGEFVTETDWGTGASLTAQITQDLFSRADTKKTFTKQFKKHVYHKDDLTFTVGPNGSVIVKGIYKGLKFSFTSYLQPMAGDETNGYYAYFCTVPYPDNSDFLLVYFYVDKNGNWIDDFQF